MRRQPLVERRVDWSVAVTAHPGVRKWTRDARDGQMRFLYFQIAVIDLTVYARSQAVDLGDQISLLPLESSSLGDGIYGFIGSAASSARPTKDAAARGNCCSPDTATKRSIPTQRKVSKIQYIRGFNLTWRQRGRDNDGDFAH